MKGRILKMIKMPPKTIRYGNRLSIWGGIILITFLAGSMIYFSHQRRETAYEWFPAAVMLFPCGFQWYFSSTGLDPILLLFGWSFYAICSLILLINEKKTVFIGTATTLLLALCLNLHGCARGIH